MSLEDFAIDRATEMAIVMMITAAFAYLSSGGNDPNVINALIGMIIILMSQLLT